MTILAALAATAAAVLTQLGPAADTRTPLYYADHTTTTGWGVTEAVDRWNRNIRVVLVEVPACTPDLQPCTTIVEQYDHQAGLVPRRTVLGVWMWGAYGENKTNHLSRVELYTWHRDFGLFRRATVCHEIGHFVYGSGEHLPSGCMTARAGSRFPGAAARNGIPARAVTP